MKLINVKKKDIDHSFASAEVLFAYQFGSSLKGNMIESSDIDIAVYFSDKLASKIRFARRLELLNNLSRLFGKIDLVVLNDVRSLLFKYVVIKEGKLIFNQDEDRQSDFECRLMGEFFDYQPFLDLYQQHYVEANV